MEFEWNIFPRFNTLLLSEEVKRLDTRECQRKNHIYVDVQRHLMEKWRQWKGIIFCDRYDNKDECLKNAETVTGNICGWKDNEKECMANAKPVSLYARRFGKGQWSFIGPGSENKWYCISEDNPQRVWDNTAERMLMEYAESGCPIFRATTPLSRGQLKSKGHGKLSIHYARGLETVETTFRILVVCANQLSLHGAVAEICEEYESLHERTGRPVVMAQSVPHSCSVRARQKYLWIVITRSTKIFYCSNMENELKSYHNKTNWANFVWMQDFWMLLKLDNTSRRKTLQISHNFMQWPVVNTLFQEKKKHHNQKDGSKGTQRLGPY